MRDDSDCSRALSVYLFPALRSGAKAIFEIMMGTLQIELAAPNRRQASQDLEDGSEAAIAFAKAS